MSGVVDDRSDQALALASARGDDGAFAVLVRRYLRSALAVAQEYVRARDDAEDVVQEAFRRVWQALPMFDSRREFRPWFFTVLRNAARNAAKQERRRRHEPLLERTATTAPGPHELVQRGELRRRIDAAVLSLPEQQRACFRLCLVEGLSGADAASALGVAESTVRVHVFRARQALQSLLAEWRDAKEDA